MTSNQNYKKFIGFLNIYQVKYLIVGGYAVVYHGFNRSTKGLDIWVSPHIDNLMNFICATREFGYSSINFSPENIKNPHMLFEFGSKPNLIHIYTEITGVGFNHCYKHRSTLNKEGLSIDIININQLIKAKETASRLLDLEDTQKLLQIKKLNKN
ncbi:hypothetical protein [Chondrinema litorale]|uniref:hypothetical protein n=1 Tax=Chondrinema litorale TaxID=2994555 RepID=UPI002543EBEC|nr:hypothetical protein [Chondrinema litorale]UZR95311.1 hypothetical protein OQ292_05690 [Chondrinema litorale]